MQDKSSQSFSIRLKTAMANCGIKASALAESAGISKGYVSELIKGIKPAPSFEAAKKIADVLRISPAWLLFGETENQTSVVHEDPTPYRVAEPTIEQRMEEIERNLASSRELNLRMMKSLDDLRDLFKNRPNEP